MDVDEFCDINLDQLKKENHKGSTIIKFKGYNMVNMEESLNLDHITHGIHDPMYSKNYCFNASLIKEINYTPGCHVSNPVGKVIYGKEYPCYHYKFINKQMMIERYSRNFQRMSKENKDGGMGSQYTKNRNQIIIDFDNARRSAKKIIDPRMKLMMACVNQSNFKSTDLNHIFKVDLSALPVKIQDNRISEHRLYLSDIAENIDADYLGIVTWRWKDKCKHLMTLDQLPSLTFSPNVVYVGWMEKNWYSKSCKDHHGIQKYLDELSEYTGLKTIGIGALANQYIISKEKFMEFQSFFRNTFYHFHKKYGFDYRFHVSPKDSPRTPAVFYERFFALWIANQKMEIRQIPMLQKY